MIANLPNDFKTNWFKDIVKMFYEKNPHIKDKDSLQQINKQTVQYMMHSAKSIMTQQREAVPVKQYRAPPANEAIGITSEFTRYDTDSKKNTEWYNKAFTERQKEYEVMHAKPLAPEVDFAIKMDDSPLNNMDELIEKYKQDRENDMNPFPSPPSAASLPESAPAHSEPLHSAPLHSEPLPVIRSTSIEEKLMQPSSFIEQINEMRKEMQDMRREIDELKKRLVIEANDSPN